MSFDGQKIRLWTKRALVTDKSGPNRAGLFIVYW
jgi:hypothetical protein